MNWKQRITKARVTGKFTVKDKSLAIHFGTCALGEHCKVPSDIINIPHSLRISNNVKPIGDDFFYAVRADNYIEAEKIYKQIKTLPTDAIKVKEIK